MLRAGTKQKDGIRIISVLVLADSENEGRKSADLFPLPQRIQQIGAGDNIDSRRGDWTRRYECETKAARFFGRIIQHTPDPQGALRSLPRVQREGGRLAATIYERKKWTLFYAKYLVRWATKRCRSSGRGGRLSTDRNSRCRVRNICSCWT